MRHNRVQFGSVTILFTVILVCVSVLAVLCVATARADLAVAENYADNITGRYACESAGQTWLSQVDEALRTYGPQAAEAQLPSDTEVKDGVISTTVLGDGMELSIRIRPLAGGGYQILTWEMQAQWNENTELKLWK